MKYCCNIITMKGLDKPPGIITPMDVRRSNSVVKINPEISRAIKRQKDTNGVQYWKTSPIPRSGYPNNVAQNRSTVEKVHSLKFEFPTGLLPTITSPRQQKANSSTSIKSKKKVSNGFENGNRGHGNNSTVDFSIPSDKDANFGGPRKAAVADLTCLQLVDTLSNHNASVPSGLYGLSVGKVRYMDYIVDSIKSKEANEKLVKLKNSEREKQWANPFHDSNKVSHNTETEIKIEHEQVSSPRMIETEISRISIRSPEYYNRSKIRSPELRPEDIVIIEDGKDSSYKPPSILKQKGALYGVSSRPIVTPTPNDNVYSLSNGTIQRSANYNNLQTLDPTEYIHISSASSRGSGSGYGANSRSRSVRFNIADEIREFKSTEPICS